jgi:hypothetical protein
METHKIFSSFLNDSASVDDHNNLWHKYFSFVDSQKDYAAAWWICTLILQGVLVPITFLIVWSLNGASVPFLFISMLCFFINVIANMSGASFRFIFNSFMLFVLIHAFLIIVTVIPFLR